MGRYGSGGHNKTHTTVEDYRRLDSFAFHDRIMGDKYRHYKDQIYYPNETTPDIVYHVQEGKMEIMTGYTYSPLFLATVEGINGKGYRVYFECPHCWKRVRYLYKNKGNYMCRHCLNANYKIQQTSGMNKIYRQMVNIVEKKLGYTYWRAEHPGIRIVDLLVIPKPRYMRYEKYSQLLVEFKRLQNEYLELEMASMIAVLPVSMRNDLLRQISEME